MSKGFPAPPWDYCAWYRSARESNFSEQPLVKTLIIVIIPHYKLYLIINMPALPQPLGWDNLEVCIVYHFTRIAPWGSVQVSTAAVGLIMHLIAPSEWLSG